MQQKVDYDETYFSTLNTTQHYKWTHSFINDNSDSNTNILGKQGETKTANIVGICPIGKVQNKIFDSCTLYDPEHVQILHMHIFSFRNSWHQWEHRFSQQFCNDECLFSYLTYHSLWRTVYMDRKYGNWIICLFEVVTIPLTFTGLDYQTIMYWCHFICSCLPTDIMKTYYNKQLNYNFIFSIEQKFLQILVSSFHCVC